MPEGTYGPPSSRQNYFVIKDYNFSDLYVLLVGHLSNRTMDARPLVKPWSKNTQLRSEQVEAMLRTLTAGMLMRARARRLPEGEQAQLDCRPTAEVLAHMQQKK